MLQKRFGSLQSGQEQVESEWGGPSAAGTAFIMDWHPLPAGPYASVMRPLRILSLCAAFALGCAHACAAADGRQQVSLNPGWRFLAGDEPRATEPGFDDSSWTAVDLPHTWNALDGEDGGNNYRRGPGWYRRHLTVDASLAGRRLYLQFDGASLMADVYVNGTHVGTHKGGFARFRFDATGVLRPGRTT